MTEHQAFTNWRDLPHAERLNGWTVWVVSLAHRGVKAIEESRPAFDTWLTSVRLTDWHEFDAWMAAARYAEHS